MSTAQSKHDASISFLAKKPSIIGLDGIVLSTAEAHLFNKRGDMFREPDGLAFDPSTKTLYNIEYKTNNYNPYKAYEQLRSSGHKLKQIFEDWTIRNLYVCENYKVKEL